MIAEFPSWRFYKHKLETGVRPEDRPVVKTSLDLGTLAMINVQAKESQQGMSKCNPTEAACVELLIREIKKCYDNVGYDKKAVGLDQVGVITPYAAQVAEIRRALQGIQGSQATQVSSVDAFQGSEKEIIILSMVRSNLRGELGFVSDWRRLNVAVTRAKRLLVVIGNMETLSQSALWRDFFGFHKSLKVFQWQSPSSGLGPLSPEPQRLLK